MNPLSAYKRVPNTYIKLPSQGRWNNGNIEMTNSNEVPVYPMNAMDELMLNTPDAILNGEALVNIIKNCVPVIKDPNNLPIPDLESIFVAIKKANMNNNEMFIYNSKCPIKTCEHENTVGIDLQMVLDSQSYIEEKDCLFEIEMGNGTLQIEIKPYTLFLRHKFIEAELENSLMSKHISTNDKLSNIEKAAETAKLTEKQGMLSFDLVSKSITAVTIMKTGERITDPKFIYDWLLDIDKEKANTIISNVNKLNDFGINKNLKLKCEKCEHIWDEKWEIDPTSFFS